MVQPALRIDSARAAADAARQLETPAEVASFEAAVAESPASRAFLDSAEWRAIRQRIVGDGRPPLGRPRSLEELARFFRYSADGAFSEEPLSEETRRAYTHCAAELDAFAARAPRAERAAPASPVAATPAARPEGMPFADAIRAVQAGGHIARATWRNGSYVTMQAAYPQGIGINANTAQATGLPQGAVVVFRPYLMRCIASGAAEVRGHRYEAGPVFVPWTPGQDDLFAEDWQLWARPEPQD